jgi:hypothetical protein
MHEQKVNQWRQAVDVVVPQTRPDFDQVYVRSDRRSRLKWTGACMAGIAAAALVFTLVQPPAAPSFDGQVAAFVGMVYEN